ncbi:amidohydrolase [Hoyosella sp. G463]|uniref:Amidohydrolase n=1 Tax=Lolliginicoccus lacisalsi TaxID=2742202 RepID=A0A927PM83_9ACTN|nr:amidohydrolase [Lolliginicoccus lacisalsi]
MWGHIEHWLASHRAQIVQWRRHLHRRPELARAEHRTTTFLEEKLRAAGLAPVRFPGGTGLLLDMGPADAAGRRLTIRADIDALPMQERTNAEYASTVPGVAHMCGHDAHATILLATALALASVPELPRGVRMIFQPAEEVMPGGALDVIASGAMEGVSRIFALHCDPRLEVGRIGIRTGAVTSAADFVEIGFSSAGGHTSRPHLTTDLVYAMGLVITSVPALLTRRIDPRTSTVMAWGAAHAGDAANALPREGVLRGTIRTGDHATWALLEPLIREIVTSVVAPTGVELEIRYRRGVPPVVNDAASTAMLRRAAERIGPGAAAPTEQSGGGEDFSWYLEHAPGAMARLGVWSGSGPQSDLHQPTFDIDERALEHGVRLLAGLVLDASGPTA